MQSNEASDRIIGLSLLSYLADGQLSSNQAEAFLRESLSIFSTNLQSPFNSHFKVVQHTIKAFNYTLQAVRSSAQMEAMQELTPLLMQNLSAMMTSKIKAMDADEELDIDDEEVKSFLEDLIDMADHTVEFFPPHYASFLPQLLVVLEDWHPVLSISLKDFII